ncbi:FHA domain-containing protein [Aliikangiella sp. IMCC44653]
MPDNKRNTSETGPQGTQVFELSDVNKMIASEILEAQSPNATTPALVGVSSNVSGQQFVLFKNKLEVGRRPNSDIILNDSSVSSMHAQLINEGGHWKVLNLLSSNGTFVNGEKVTEKFIAPGDRVAFAGAEFVMTLVEQQPSESHSSNLSFLLAGAALVAALAGVLYFII